MKLTMKMEWGCLCKHITHFNTPPPHTYTCRFLFFEIKSKIRDVCHRLSFIKPSLAKTNISHPNTNL